MKHTRITSSEIARAKEAAAEAGLCLTGLEKRPDGTVRLEFGSLQAATLNPLDRLHHG